MDYALITFFIILGAGAFVIIGFVVARFWNKEEHSGMKDPSNEQVEYMRSVRHRYLDTLEWTARLACLYPYILSVTELFREANRENRYNQRPSFAA